MANNFSSCPREFNRFTDRQWTFLRSYLLHRGDLEALSADLGISRQQAEDMFAALANALEPVPEGLASQAVRSKLYAAGGHVTVYTARGLPCEVWAENDGQTFGCDKLPVHPPYGYKVFDVIVNLLEQQGGRARKGNGRNYRLGDPQCDQTTVVGAVALHYSGKKPGDSVFDPVFVLAAILEWAGIARNGRGELILL